MTTARQIVDALRAQVPPVSYGAIAKQTGFSKAAIVLWYGNKYPAKPDRLEAAIVAGYDTVACPHTGAAMPRHKCREFHTRSIPTGAPKALAHWRACQSCPNKTTEAQP